MKFQEILHGKHFNQLAAPLVVAFHAQPSPHNNEYKKLKSEVPFWTLWKKFDKATPIDVPINKAEAISAFIELITSVTQAMPETLWYEEEDIAWLVQVLDSKNASTVLSMFKAWISAEHTYLTPGQVAKITGMSESNWRNRAAAQPGYKAIPGCRKPGKDWMIPLCVLQAQGEIDWSYRPERVDRIKRS